MHVDQGYWEGSPTDLENRDLECTKRYFNGQFCCAPGAVVVLESLDPLQIQVRCKAHAQWGGKPFKKGNRNYKYYGKYQLRLPLVMPIEEFVIFVVMHL